jgi:hypothetical protein
MRTRPDSTAAKSAPTGSSSNQTDLRTPHASLASITPALELFPDGGVTKWDRLKKRFQLSSKWLLDAVLKAAIGAAIASLVQHVA